MVAARGGGEIPLQGPVHHLAVWQLHRRVHQRQPQRHQHSGREHRGQWRHQEGVQGLQQLGEKERAGAAATRILQVQPQADVLDQRRQHLVCQAQGL